MAPADCGQTPASSTPARQRLRQSLGYGLAAAVCAVLIYGLRSDWAEVDIIRRPPDPWALAAHLGLMALTFLLLVCGWTYAVHSCGAPMSLREGAGTWLLANLGKYVPGKVLMLAGRVELSRRTGIRPALGVTAMTLEHLMLLLAALPFTLWAFSQSAPMPSAVRLGGLLLLGLSAAILLRPALLLRLTNSALVRVGRDPLATIPSSHHMFMLLAIHLGAWTCYAAGGATLAHALHASDHVGAIDVGSAFVASWLLGFLSVVTPGGLGVREAALVLLLRPTLSLPQATGLALVARLTWTGVEAAGILLGLFLCRRGLSS
jgi:uncharacterized membrane protein YbhN (UPF0104 family)